jgi:hypothetical protein
MTATLAIERYARSGHGSVNSYILSSPTGMAPIEPQRTSPEARERLERLAMVGEPLVRANRRLVVAHDPKAENPIPSVTAARRPLRLPTSNERC